MSPDDEAGDERPTPASTPLDALINELAGVVPEVRDAALSVADALLDVARTLIDAAERACGPSPTDDPGAPRP